MVDLNSQTVAQLRAIAKELKLSGYSKMKKSELIDLIDRTLPPASSEIVDVKYPVEETKSVWEDRIRKMNRHERRKKAKLARMHG